MNLKSHTQIYETIGKQYKSKRQPDPRIAAAVRRALGEVKSVVNIGAGAGSYEPEDIDVTAVEPSATMIAQRSPSASTRIVQTAAEDLPFEDNEFDASMAILTVHHWEDPIKGLAEMRRVSERQVIFAFDQGAHNAFWLVQDYLPEIEAFENARGLSFAEIVNQMQAMEVIHIPIPHDCLDGFQAAYWRRPEAYLEEDVRANISTFAQLSPSIVDRAVNRLRADLRTGKWQERHQNLLELDELDCGYRLICAGASLGQQK